MTEKPKEKGKGETTGEKIGGIIGKALDYAWRGWTEKDEKKAK